MNKPKAKLLKISIAVLVIFTLVTVLIVYAANVDGLVDPSGDEWDQGIPILDMPDIPLSSMDITAAYGEYGTAAAWFRIDVDGPPPFTGGGGQTADIYIVIQNHAPTAPIPLSCPDPTPIGGFTDLNNYYIHATNNTGSGFGWNTSVFWCNGGIWQAVAPPSGPWLTVSQNIVEVEVPLVDIGFTDPPLPTDDMDFFVYYELNAGGPPIIWDYLPDGPQAQSLIDLASLNATAGEDGVLVEWETASEIDNAGFNVYRQAAEGEFIRLNAALIPAQGGPTQGAAYSFLNEGAAGGYYKLEDVDTSGTSTLHGPISAEGGDPTAVGLVSIATSTPMALLVIPLLALGAGGLALLRRKRR